MSVCVYVCMYMYVCVCEYLQCTIIEKIKLIYRNPGNLFLEYFSHRI